MARHLCAETRSKASSSTNAKRPRERGICFVMLISEGDWSRRPRGGIAQARITEILAIFSCRQIAPIRHVNRKRESRGMQPSSRVTIVNATGDKSYRRGAHAAGNFGNRLRFDRCAGTDRKLQAHSRDKAEMNRRQSRPKRSKMTSGLPATSAFAPASSRGNNRLRTYSATRPSTPSFLPVV